jgi:hypothetical protein
MQTPPSTPAPTVAPGAPIRQRFIAKRSKSTPALSAEDKAALIPQLQAIRAKHAPRVLYLARIALEALEALQDLEDTMDEEARALYPEYVHDLQDYKLTFEHECPERAEQYDDDAPFLQQAILVVEAMEAEAAAVHLPAA